MPHASFSPQLRVRWRQRWAVAGPPNQLARPSPLQPSALCPHDLHARRRRRGSPGVRQGDGQRPSNTGPPPGARPPGRRATHCDSLRRSSRNTPVQLHHTAGGAGLAGAKHRLQRQSSHVKVQRIAMIVGSAPAARLPGGAAAMASGTHAAPAADPPPHPHCLTNGACTVARWHGRVKGREEAWICCQAQPCSRLGAQGNWGRGWGRRGWEGGSASRHTLRPAL